MSSCAERLVRWKLVTLLLCKVTPQTRTTSWVCVMIRRKAADWLMTMYYTLKPRSAAAAQVFFTKV
mgnify:CR=1 FL=1